MARNNRMLPTLICLLYIFISTQAFPNNYSSTVALQATHVKLTFGKSVGVLEEAKKSFGANAFARANCYYDGENIADYNSCAATVTRFRENGVVDNNSTCNFNIFNYENEEMLSDIKFSLEKNRVFFVYETKAKNDLNFRDVYQTYKIVRPGVSEDPCEYSEVTIKLGSPLPFIRQINAVTYTNIIYHDNDYFDIFADGDCGGARCKYSFNNEAKSIGNPVPFLPLSYQNHFMKIYPSTSSKAHFAFVAVWPKYTYQPPRTLREYVTDGYFDSQTLLHVDGDRVTELATYYCRSQSDRDLFLENSNGLFSVCKRFANKINCVLFNESSMKFNETVSVASSEKLIATYNVPKGDIILVKSNCSGISCKGLLFQNLTHDPEDQKLYSVKDIEFELPILKAIVHIEKDNKLCISMYNEERIFDGGYRSLVECFSNPYPSIPPPPAPNNVPNQISQSPNSGERVQSYILTCFTILFFTVINVSLIP